VFALVDCNNFFASCERVFNPGLRDKPVLILSNNDGCVIARSNEVKALGVKMGVPFHEVKELCRKQKVNVFSCNFTLYGSLSHRVFNTLRSDVPTIEVYSIDEAFLDLSGWPEEELIPRMIALREKVKQWTGIPVSIGIAPTKALAKLANGIAKKNPTQQGVYKLADEWQVVDALAGIEVGEVWGVGRALTGSLQSVGIQTALQLRNADTHFIRQRYNVVMEKLVWELRGVSCLPLHEVESRRGSIQCSRSFGYKVEKLEDMQEAIATHCAKAGEKLRKQGLLANGVLVYLTTSRFNPREPFYRNSAILTFPHPTADTALIVATAQKAMGSIFKTGYRYHKCGLSMQELVPQERVQYGLFSHGDSPRTQAMWEAVDGLNKRFGKNMVRPLGMGIEQRWAARSNSLSPFYTSSWDGLMQVK
jgi:DNA polymerase V